jgi:hypothetical protein
MSKMENVTYTLYKEPMSLDTLYIVQYLHAHGTTLIPKYIIERNHGVSVLPSVAHGDKLYLGLLEVVKFYENASGISNLLIKAREWKENNPDYRITDRPS